MRIDLLPTILAAAPPAALYLLARFPEMALAGGLPRDAAIGVEPRDADLVIVGPPSDDLRALLRDPSEWQLEAALDDMRNMRDDAGAPAALTDAAVVKTARAVTFILTGRSVPVQVIRTEHASVAAALASFDFGVCQAAVRLTRTDGPGLADHLVGLQTGEDDRVETARFEDGALALLEYLPAFARDLPGRWLCYASPRDNDVAGSIRRALDLVGRGHGWKLEPDELQRMVAAQLDRQGVADPEGLADLAVCASGPPTASSREAVRAATSGRGEKRHAPEPDRLAMPIPPSALELSLGASSETAAMAKTRAALADHGSGDLFADAGPRPYAGCGCPEHDMGCAGLPRVDAPKLASQPLSLGERLVLHVPGEVPVDAEVVGCVRPWPNAELTAVIRTNDGREFRTSLKESLTAGGTRAEGFRAIGYTDVVLHRADARGA